MASWVLRGLLLCLLLVFSLYIYRTLHSTTNNSPYSNASSPFAFIGEAISNYTNQITMPMKFIDSSTINTTHSHNMNSSYLPSESLTVPPNASSWRSIFKSTSVANEASTKVKGISVWKSIFGGNKNKTSSKSTGGPDLSRQKAPREKDWLKLHLCNEGFEAYSASWLTTKQHMLAVDSLQYNLTWVNCEMASFIHMSDRVINLKEEHKQGLIMQSLDVLDFSVIHLSTFERVHKKYQKKLWPNIKKDKERLAYWGNIDVVKNTSAVLAESVKSMKLTWSPEAQRTVAIMPFLGGAMGAGHSVLSNRYVYLESCFWSIYKFIPNIIVSVTSESDVEWARTKSGMPFYDVYLMKGLPKPAGLPVATTQETKRRLMSGKLDFDYVFFTESDQILLWRTQQYMYDYLKAFPEHMLLPHRLMAYSSRAIEEIHRRPLSQNYVEKKEALLSTTALWDSKSCCLARQNCVSRKRWVHIKSSAVVALNYMGMEIPLGNVNFLDEMYRHCKLTDALEICP